MGISAKYLTNALIEFDKSYGRGAKAYLAKLSGVSETVIGKLVKGQKSVAPETWEKLHQALPDAIPPLPIIYDHSDPSIENWVPKEIKKAPPENQEFANLDKNEIRLLRIFRGLTDELKQDTIEYVTDLYFTKDIKDD
ncbi:MAG: helix-turn-helix transcriptional regulator [Desulfobacteraceae bacterium]|nr:helix-turn-helix transcriptional regulator [Desulfobacteraceae bacterium]